MNSNIQSFIITSGIYALLGLLWISAPSTKTVAMEQDKVISISLITPVPAPQPTPPLPTPPIIEPLIEPKVMPNPIPPKPIIKPKPIVKTTPKQTIQKPLVQPTISTTTKATTTPPSVSAARDVDRFKALIQSKIQSNKYYPPNANNQGVEGTIKVSFKVTKKGNAYYVSDISTDGHPLLARGAKDAIQKSFPITIPSNLASTLPNTDTINTKLNYTIQEDE